MCIQSACKEIDAIEMKKLIEFFILFGVYKSIYENIFCNYVATMAILQQNSETQKFQKYEPGVIKF